MTEKSLNLLEDICEEIKNSFDEIDVIREETFLKCRSIRRLSTESIQKIHKGMLKEAKEILSSARDTVIELAEKEIQFGFVEEALCEYTEAFLLLTFLKKEPIPKPQEIGVTNKSYLLGLGDSIGELRRILLDRIRKNEWEELEYYLDLIDTIYFCLMKFNFPEAILPIRRKQDNARSISERARGEVSLAIQQKRLEEKITLSSLG